MTHQEAWETLPWLATGRLGADERSAVERHLEGCEACRRELAVQKRHAEAIGRIEPEAIAARAAAARMRRRPHAWAFAPAGALAATVLLAVGAWTALDPRRGDAPYATLSDVPTASAAEIRLRAAPGTGDEALAAALAAEGLTLPEGAEPGTLIRVPVPEGTDLATLAARLMADRAILHAAADAP